MWRAIQGAGFADSRCAARQLAQGWLHTHTHTDLPHLNTSTLLSGALTTVSGPFPVSPQQTKLKAKQRDVQAQKAHTPYVFFLMLSLPPPCLSVHLATHQIPELVAGQLALSVESHNGRVLDCTGVQTPGVLDDLFYTDEPLGDTYCRDTRTHRISVWVSQCTGRQAGAREGGCFGGSGHRARVGLLCCGWSC